jgi:hypothetical protein
LGLVALGLFGFAAIACLSPSLASYQPAALVGLRTALVLGAFWLAWPDLQRLPRWVWFALPIGLIAAVFARGVFIFAAPLLLVAMAAYLFYRRLRRPSR